MGVVNGCVIEQRTLSFLIYLTFLPNVTFVSLAVHPFYPVLIYHRMVWNPNKIAESIIDTKSLFLSMLERYNNPCTDNPTNPCVLPRSLLPIEKYFDTKDTTRPVEFSGKYFLSF